jgi:hypothetical protein
MQDAESVVAVINRLRRRAFDVVLVATLEHAVNHSGFHSNSPVRVRGQHRAQGCAALGPSPQPRAIPPASTRCAVREGCARASAHMCRAARRDVCAGIRGFCHCGVRAARPVAGPLRAGGWLGGCAACAGPLIQTLLFCRGPVSGAQCAMGAPLVPAARCCTRCQLACFVSPRRLSDLALHQLQ